jgi:glutaredoxin
MYHSYLLYIKSTCPFCTKAIDRLEKEGRRYKTIMVDDCPEGFIYELKDAYEHKSFPMALGYDATYKSYGWIGGCDDLMIHLDHPEKF